MNRTTTTLMSFLAEQGPYNMKPTETGFAIHGSDKTLTNAIVDLSEFGSRNTNTFSVTDMNTGYVEPPTHETYSLSLNGESTVLTLINPKTESFELNVGEIDMGAEISQFSYYESLRPK